MGGDGMLNIAIVEDDPQAAGLLTAYLDRYAQERGTTCNSVIFNDAVDFLTGYKASFDLVFMDSELPGLNGMEAARRLREVDRSVILIFVTNMANFAVKGYEVDAVSFLVKPVSYCDFSLKFRKALDIYIMNEDRSFTVNAPGGLCRISTDKLMYVEISNHRLCYHLIDDVIEMTGVLSGVEQELRGFGFLRCNKCYLVNPKFVVRVKGCTVQVGDSELQISRPRRASFLAELSNWYAGSMGGQ